MGKVYTPGTKAVNINNNVPTLEQSFKAAYDFGKVRKPIETLNSHVFVLLSGDACVMYSWRMLARILKMPENIIDEIIYKEKTDLREQCVLMLLRWLNANGVTASITVLLAGLRECHLTYAADVLEGYI